ncbi:MAG: PAS domain S-box protein [Candidatus Thermoplasmatota archaeon]|nr:PAS domain S-box protein [Candidatus Thermoplasmatota archaeon]
MRDKNKECMEIEEALRESEKRYRELFENANDIIWTADVKGRYTSVNKMFEKSLGYDREELIGEQSLKLVADEDKEKSIQIYRKTLGGKPQSYELKIKTKDGNTRIVMLRTMPIRENGEVIGVQGIARDITENKKVEEELRESNELKQLLMESFPNKIFFKNRKSVYVFCNSHYAADIGIAPDEIQGKTDYNFYPRDLADKYRTDDQRIMKSGQLEQMEEPYRIGNEERTVLTVKTPVRDANGNIIGVLGIFTDITERKKMEEELKQSEEKYRTLVETAQEGICIDDEDDNITFANKAFADMLRYERNEIIGMNFRELIDERQIPELERQTKIRMEGKSSKYEITLYTKDGKPRTVIVSAAPLLDVDGKYEGSISVNLDITERKKAEEKIKHLNLVLRAVRNVNQLIVGEKDKNKLIQRVCDVFIETRGYSSAWIALFDENKKFITFAKTGLGKDFAPLEELFKRGELIECCRRALKQSGVVTIKDPSACVGCPLLGKEPSEKAMTVRLEYKGKVFGLASVSIPAHLAANKEERSLFKEAVGDIAFALYNIEMEEKHKQAEEALKESEEKFRLLAESSTSAIFIYQDDIFKYANPAMEKISGYSRDELIGMKFWNVVHPDDVRVIKKRGKAREKGGKVEPHHYEFRVITKDGKTKWIDFAAANIIYEGKPAGLGNAYDVTERKRAEEALKIALEQEREFKARTAHYFFNPLCIAKGYLELAMKDERDADQREKLKAIINAVERVESVVKNVVTKGEIRE